ncbi:MAG: tRNA uridine-5-carboxymethylaminomethyl(34) synthesis GTPase MnmE [Puniceicoccales bacterium]|jgi:tRNA modification GTPase|nr:tRNA uridine-5-carboxymethylaminomethyl(34) synthesis GTPase MnmE [Puniceicoccales bacterium]
MQRGTIVALATPTGVSAIAVIRISGPLSSQLFGYFVSKDECSPKTLYHCKYLSTEKKILDDILIVFFSAINSYTGEDAVEIYCHGNMLIVEKVLADLCSRGCRFAEPGEFTKRAFLNGKLNLCQAEAVADVIHATNERAMQVAQNQLNGILSDKINEIGKNLLNILVELEKEIDFSDDEITDDDMLLQEILQKIEAIREDIKILIESNKYHSVIHDGISAVILGEPNAGKSSLFNFLLGEDRAIVSEIAGTTRDIISEKIVVGNNVLKICDTAGLRDGKLGEVEQTGIAKAMAKAASADFFLIVVNASSCALPVIPQKIIRCFNNQNALVVINKIDLPKNWYANDFLPHLDRVEISIKNATNAQALKTKILEIISRNKTLSSDVDIVVNARHVDILRRANEYLGTAQSKLFQPLHIETIASDIRQSLEILGEIIGTYDNERTLDLIFSNFCVGK